MANARSCNMFWVFPIEPYEQNYDGWCRWSIDRLEIPLTIIFWCRWWRVREWATPLLHYCCSLMTHLISSFSAGAYLRLQVLLLSGNDRTTSRPWGNASCVAIAQSTWQESTLAHPSWCWRWTACKWQPFHRTCTVCNFRCASSKRQLVRGFLESRGWSNFTRKNLSSRIFTQIQILGLVAFVGTLKTSQTDDCSLDTLESSILRRRMVRIPSFTLHGPWAQHSTLSL